MPVFQLRGPGLALLGGQVGGQQRLRPRLSQPWQHLLVGLGEHLPERDVLFGDRLEHGERGATVAGLDQPLGLLERPRHRVDGRAAIPVVVPVPPPAEAPQRRLDLLSNDLRVDRDRRRDGCRRGGSRRPRPGTRRRRGGWLWRGGQERHLRLDHAHEPRLGLG